MTHSKTRLNIKQKKADASDQSFSKDRIVRKKRPSIMMDQIAAEMSPSSSMLAPSNEKKKCGNLVVAKTSL